MDFRKTILNRLLDKYERSKAYLNGKATRRIMLKLCAGDMPEYDLGSTQVRELINSTVQSLAGAGIVEYEWMKFERGNIIEKVWLCIERVEDAYREAQRTPKSKKARLVLKEIKKCLPGIKQPWIRDFFEDALQGIDAKKSITPYLPGDIDIALATLHALMKIDSLGDEECSERVFSIKNFGDSKYFEINIKKNVVRIIRKYLVMEHSIVEKPDDEEILAQVGIVKIFGQVEFCGNISGYIYNEAVDFSIFPYGIALNSHTVKGLEMGYENKIKRILFIENKTNYMEYILNKKRKDELVVFHGGFYSPLRGEFFKKIYKAGQGVEAEFYHWGDIDIGGFRMFKRLKENIAPSLKPYLMDKNAFMSKEKSWLPINKRYKKALEGMLKDKGYFEFHDVIGVMLKVRGRLEQEAFL